MEKFELETFPVPRTFAGSFRVSLVIELGGLRDL